MANSSDTSTQLTLTQLGHTTILQSGVDKAFKNFTIGDSGIRYDNNTTPNLSDALLGGTRTLVTSAPSCHMASSKPISKKKQTVEELKQISTKVEWEISRLDCGGTTYTANNPNIVVDLRTWFNYLIDKVDVDNYDFNNKLRINLTDSIKANLQTLDPSTYTYVTKNTVDNIDVSYTLNTQTSCDNYTNLNTRLMSVNGGKKKLIENTDKRFWSPMLLMADTGEDDVSKSNDWIMTLNGITWGYATIPIESTDSTFYRSGFLDITTVESMSEQEIENTFRAIVPACLTHKSSNDGMFYLTDTAGVYSKSVDGLGTFANRMHNVNGLSLIESLVLKAESFIQSTFTESTETIGLYEQIITLNVNNKTINGKTYNTEQITGGNMTITLQWDSNLTTSTYDDIVTWI